MRATPGENFLLEKGRHFGVWVSLLFMFSVY